MPLTYILPVCRKEPINFIYLKMQIKHFKETDLIGQDHSLVKSSAIFTLLSQRLCN